MLIIFILSIFYFLFILRSSTHDGIYKYLYLSFRKSLNLNPKFSLVFTNFTLIYIPFIILNILLYIYLLSFNKKISYNLMLIPLGFFLGYIYFCIKNKYTFIKIHIPKTLDSLITLLDILFLAYVEEFLFRKCGILALSFLPLFYRIFFLGVLFHLSHYFYDKSMFEDSSLLRIKYLYLFLDRFLFHVFLSTLFIISKSILLPLFVHFSYNLYYEFSTFE